MNSQFLAFPYKYNGPKNNEGAQHVPEYSIPVMLMACVSTQGTLIVRTNYASESKLSQSVLGY